MITSCQLEFYDQQDQRPSYNPEHHPHNGSGAIRSLGQLCINEMSACSVDEFGITPNWFRSILSRIAGPT